MEMTSPVAQQHLQPLALLCWQHGEAYPHEEQMSTDSDLVTIIDRTALIENILSQICLIRYF